MNSINELNPFPIERTKVYGVISDQEKLDDDSHLLTVDLVNREMIAFDKEVIYSQNRDSNILSDNPKDYLYLYFMTVSVDYEKYEHNFYIQKSGDVYEYELIPITQYDEENDGEAILCDVYFTASPISENSYYIKMIGRVFPIPITIPHFKNAPLSRLTDIKTELDSVMSWPLNVDYFRVHNVGQGSCNTAVFHSNNKLFYDIGITKYSKKDAFYKKYTNAFSKFKLCNYDVVILSHWDIDHYLGISLDTSGEILRKNWIVPDIENSPNLMRIAYIIDNFGRLTRIANSVSGEFYKKDDLVLCKGSGSAKNDSGIILCVVDGSTYRLVAMGDVSYNCADFLVSRSKKAFKSIDYLVVPHHGAEVDGNIIFNPRVPITASGYSVCPSDAIISVGYNPKTYSHPRRNTVVKLHKKEFRILRTDKDGRQIIKL